MWADPGPERQVAPGNTGGSPEPGSVLRAVTFPIDQVLQASTPTAGTKDAAHRVHIPRI